MSSSIDKTIKIKKMIFIRLINESFFFGFSASAFSKYANSSPLIKSSALKLKSLININLSIRIFFYNIVLRLIIGTDTGGIENKAAHAQRTDNR